MSDSLLSALIAGDSDSYTYDQSTGRMTQYKFTVNGQSLTGTLTWNPNGTLGGLAISDPFNSSDTQTCTYTHDDLTRIAGANCGSAASQTFSYDPFGNIDKSGAPSSFQPTYSSTTNHMAEIGSQTPTYDADGDVTNDFLNQYSWDANGRPVTVANSSGSVSVTYDALGRMIEQDKGGSYYEMVYAPAGNKLAFMTGQTLSKAYVPLPAGDVAAYNSSGLNNYHHVDWLGSFRLASTPSRTVPFDTAYAPFGEPYADSANYTFAFTGQTQDTTSTVYDFPAREYGIQGRWPSPDPAGIASVNPADPQTWNRYAYVRNSPLAMTDPTGFGPPPLMPDPIQVTTTVYLCDQTCQFYVQLFFGGYSWLSLGSVGAGVPIPIGGGGGGGAGGSGSSSSGPPSVNGKQPQTTSCTVNGEVTGATPVPGEPFGFPPPPGSVAIDPMSLGLFPGEQTNDLLAPYASQIFFSFDPAPNLPQGFPTTHTLGSILGPKMYRAGGSAFRGYIFDIQGMPSDAAANAATVPSATVTVTFPSSLPINCGGPLADPVLPPSGQIPAVRRVVRW